MQMRWFFSGQNHNPIHGGFVTFRLFSIFWFENTFMCISPFASINMVEVKYCMYILVFVQFMHPPLRSFPLVWGWIGQTYQRNTSYLMHIHPLNRFPSEAPYVELLLPPCNIFWHLTEAKHLLPLCTVTPAPWHKQPWTEQSCGILCVMPSARSSLNCRDQRRRMLVWQPVPRQH